MTPINLKSPTLLGVVKKDPKLDLPDPDQNFHGKTGVAFGVDRPTLRKDNFTTNDSDFDDIFASDDSSFGDSLDNFEFGTDATNDMNEYASAEDVGDCTPEEYQEYQDYLDAGGIYDEDSEYYDGTENNMEEIGDMPPPAKNNLTPPPINRDISAQQSTPISRNSPIINGAPTRPPVQSDNPLMRGNPLLHGAPLRPTHGLKETRPTHGLKETRPTHGLKETRPTHGLKETRPTHGLKETRITHGLKETGASSNGLKETRPTHGLKETGASSNGLPLRGGVKEGVLPPPPKGGGYALKDIPIRDGGKDLPPPPPSRGDGAIGGGSSSSVNVSDLYDMSAMSDISSDCGCPTGEDKIIEPPKNCGKAAQRKCCGTPGCGCEKGPRGPKGDRGPTGSPGASYKIGCGLEVISNHLQIKAEDIAGAGLNYDGCELSIDNVVDGSKTISLQTTSNVSIGCINGVIVLTLTHKTYDVKFNDAGIIIGIELTDTTTANRYLNLCNCECDPTPPTSSSGSGSPENCCWAGEVLQLTWSGNACVDDEVLTMTPTGPGHTTWLSSTFTYCGMTGSNMLVLNCTDGEWTLTPYTGCPDETCCFPLQQGSGPGEVISCDPLEVEFQVEVDSSCGGPGTVTLTVTS
jgi:hypothetical protein